MIPSVVETGFSSRSLPGDCRILLSLIEMFNSASFIFKDEETNVSSWRNFYELVAKNLYNQDPFLFKSFIDDSDFITNKNKRYISESENELRSAIKIDDSIFLESNLGAEYILENIRKMLNKFEMIEDDIIIKLASN